MYYRKEYLNVNLRSPVVNLCNFQLEVLDGHLSQHLPRLHLNLVCVASEKLTGGLVTEV